MRRPLVVVLLSVAAVTKAYTDGADEPPSVDQVLRIVIETPDDRQKRFLAISIAAEFAARSATFSDLLIRLREVQHLILYLKFAQLRAMPPSGRARFEVARNGIVIGFIEMDAGLVHPLSKMGAILVHELAHAYEVSCWADVRTTAELLEKLRARAVPEKHGNSAETPFAAAVEKAVLDEWSSDARAASRLRALFATHGPPTPSC